MANKRPDISLKFKSQDGQYYEIGNVWLNEFGGGNFTPVLEDVAHEKYPKMAFAKALKLNSEKKGFINVFANGGKGSRITITGGPNEEF